MAQTIRLVNSGAEFFEVQGQLIASAKKEIHFQTYSLDLDAVGIPTIEALKAAVARGVEVYMVLDSFGSNKLGNDFAADMEAAGIHFRFFAPLFSMKGLHLGRRMHHKILTIDNQTALIGGINTTEKYHGTAEEPAWLDFAVVVEGTPAVEAVEICRQLFGRRQTARAWFRRTPKKPGGGERPEVRVLHNDYLLHKTEIYDAYVAQVRQAKESILLIASYFSPGKRFRRALVDATRRGVKIKVILPGISDVPLMKYGTVFLYDLLFRHQVEIVEWGNSILHAKGMIVDGKWCTIGSFNMINLSIYGSIETNVEITDKAFIKTYDDRLCEVCDNCKKIKASTYKKNKFWLGQFRNWMSYHLIRRMFYFMTFFSYKRLGSAYVKD